MMVSLQGWGKLKNQKENPNYLCDFIKHQRKFTGKIKLSGLCRVPQVNAWANLSIWILVTLSSNPPAFLKNGNLFNHRENSKKPDNYCNDGNRWKCNEQFHRNSKSEYFLAWWLTLSATVKFGCNKAIQYWWENTGTITTFLKQKWSSQRNIINACKAVSVYSQNNWRIGVILDWNCSL